MESMLVNDVGKRRGDVGRKGWFGKKEKSGGGFDVQEIWLVAKWEVASPTIQFITRQLQHEQGEGDCHTRRIPNPNITQSPFLHQ